MNPKAQAIVEQDLVLIYVEEKPAFYARVEKISPDVKPKWWQVKFLMLTIPVNLTTWIIDDEQIRGADFTMGGTPIRIEKVEIPPEIAPPGKQQEGEESAETTAGKPQPARVLSMDKKRNPKRES
ncbi:MAG: hypothetical protein ACE5G1_17415 [bacterium]